MQSYGYIAKHLYASVIVDEGSRFTYTYCIKSKDELQKCIVEYIALVERQSSDRVLALFSDNEPVLLQNDFQDWLRNSGIRHFTTQTYSPEMNGIAENAIKQIISRASAMLSTAEIPVGFWPEAVRCATYLKNRSPYKAIDKTPFEAYYGAPPELSHLRIFGCRCYAHLEKEHRQKLDSHCIECVFMGYYSTERLFAVFDVSKHVMLKKRDVIFLEHVLGHPTIAQYGLAPGYDIVGRPMPQFSDFHPTSNAPIAQPTSTSNVPVSSNAIPTVADPTPKSPSATNPTATNPVDVLPPDNGDHAFFTSADPGSSPTKLNVRDIVRAHWSNASFWKHATLTASDPSLLLQHFTSVYDMWCIRLNLNDLPMDVSLAVTDETDPTIWASAMASPNCRWWLLAAYQEMCQLAQMGTFVFTDAPPPNRKALATKWIWKTKRSPDGKIERFKARWVARGDLQKKGIDYGETFAPVAMLISIRVLLTLVALLDL